MRKRKLYLSELLKRNKNPQLYLTIDINGVLQHYETTKDINALQYHDCEVKHWKVIKTEFRYVLIVKL